MRPGERTALFIVPALLAAASGQHAEAAAHLRRIEEEQAGESCAGLAVVRALGRIFALSEQHETGTPFDDAVAAYEAVALPPAITIRAYRVTLCRIAMGRLAQLRVAVDADRGMRLAQARVAVANLGKGARDDISRSWRSVARADLLVLTDQPRRALRLLNGDEAIHQPAAPLLAYEKARVRARALQALCDVEEARHQAHLALVLAEEGGWPHRAEWVLREFAAIVGPGQRLTPDASGLRPAARHLPGGHTGAAGEHRTSGHSVHQDRLRALQQVGFAASRVLDPHALVRIILDETIRILHAERAFLFLATEADDRLTPYLGRDTTATDLPQLTGYSTSLVERVRVTREPLVITGTDEGAALGAESVVLHGLRSIMVAPLLLDERLLGLIYLDSQVAKGIFTADDAGILIALTNHIATSLETARAAQLEISVQTAQRQRDLAERLRTAFEAMSDTLDPAAVLDRLLHWVGRLVAQDGVWLITSQGGDDTLTESVEDGTPLRQVMSGDVDTTALLAVDQSRVGADLGIPGVLLRRVPEATAWATLPLRSREAALGVIVIASTAPCERLRQEVEVAAALVAHGMTAYDNASLFAKVQELAVVDELTGIANRRRFFELAERDLGEANRDNRSLVAVMMDIDHFKRVNDTFGHQTGDDVIRVVASRLARLMRRTDVLGRYGGEEFAAVIANVDLAAGHEFAERLRLCVANEPIQTRSGPMTLTVSIGLAQVVATDEHVSMALARADQALYQAKQDGRNRAVSIIS